MAIDPVNTLESTPTSKSIVHKLLLLRPTSICHMYVLIVYNCIQHTQGDAFYNVPLSAAAF